MELKDIEKQVELICKPKHEPIEKKIKELDDNKADIGEVENLKDWVLKLDARIWAAMITALLSAISAVGALAAMLLNKH